MFRHTTFYVNTNALITQVAIGVAIVAYGVSVCKRAVYNSPIDVIKKDIEFLGGIR